MFDDLQLIELTKQGHLKAYKSLISKYKDRIYNIAFSFTANADESEDIAQKVFLKAYSNLNSFLKKSAFSTWLYRIAVNECCSALSRKKHNAADLDAPIGQEESLYLKDLIEDKTLCAENILLSKEMQTLIRKCISALPDKYKAVITLREMEDISYKEIADILKISRQKVKIRLFRARNKLKEIIKKEIK
ncbi:MAG: sigma-70 family RNA polymerase sigma factor [Endomicrobium sp.]|jgi:RNA polymerase sigma-70 factor (ECF subfamily)|nr:sigma-70 family RNA polymerase sigma factor [Endomicrobium sp.]